jgi:hypothetical protein
MKTVNNQQHHYLHLKDTLGVIDDTGVTEHVHGVGLQKTFFVQFSLADVSDDATFDPVLGL